MVDDALLAFDGRVGQYANAMRIPPRGYTYRVAPLSAVHDVHPLHSAVNCQCVELDLVPVLKRVYCASA